MTQQQSATTSERYIFVVGVSRSGTTLMRSILNASDHIAICRETHFLGHLIASEGARHRFRKFGDLTDDQNVERLVDYIFSDDFTHSSRFRGVSSHWRWITRRVTRDELLQRLRQSDRSERAIFSTIMRLYAERKGKPIMGEKTPAHVRYVPKLLNWYPEGRVIHMLRDPRGIFVSELRRRKKDAVTTPYKQLVRLGPLFKLYIMLQTTVVWLESVYWYRTYKNVYPNNYYLLRFEDLVRDPEVHIRQLCEFLGIEFQANMLEQVVVSKGFEAGRAGFDGRAADRWREHIDPWINAWFAFWFRRHLRGFDYSI